MNERNPGNFYYYLFGFKRIKNVFQLVLVIAIHILGWMIIFSFPVFLFRIEITDPNFWYKELVNKIFFIAFFYVNYFVLIPKLFIRNKKVLFFITIAFLFCLLLFQQLLVEKIFLEGRPTFNDGSFVNNGRIKGFNYNSNPLPPQPRPGMWPGFATENMRILGFPKHIFIIVLTQSIYSFFLVFLLGAFIYLTYFFFKNQDEKKSLENANLQAEISLLKSQINPHFLFNTLNTIYAQAHKRSEYTDDSILKLSEILRYMIYDTTSEKINLHKDVHYLSSYIELQKLRLSEKVSVHYNIEGDLAGLSIVPLLLITFVENAFKHGVSYSQSSQIIISISVFHKMLTLMVINPIVNNSIFNVAGIGLKNARRRLELLYPSSHSLIINKDGGKYIVTLKLILSND